MIFPLDQETFICTPVIPVQERASNHAEEIWNLGDIKKCFQRPIKFFFMSDEGYLITIKQFVIP